MYDANEFFVIAAGSEASNAHEVEIIASLFLKPLH